MRSQWHLLIILAAVLSGCCAANPALAQDPPIARVDIQPARGPQRDAS